MASIWRSPKHLLFYTIHWQLLVLWNYLTNANRPQAYHFSLYWCFPVYTIWDTFLFSCSVSSLFNQIWNTSKLNRLWWTTLLALVKRVVSKLWLLFFVFWTNVPTIQTVSVNYNCYSSLICSNFNCNLSLYMTTIWNSR